MSADTPQRWMRDAALLAAALCVQTPPDAPVAPREGWPGASEAWAALTLRARALALTPAAWAEAAAAAAETEPEAAAAFSILAESERVMLPTPAVFARLAVSGLGLDYDAALGAALAPSPRLQRVETAGHALPAAHTAFRLPPEGVARLVAAAPLPMGECLPATHRPVFARHAAVAARLLAEDGAVWLRGPSRRLARQLAHDLATFTPARAALFVAARADMALPEDASDALLVLDCHALDRLPILPRGTGRLAVLASDTHEPPGLRAVDAPPLDHHAQAAIWAEAALPCLDTDRLSCRFRLTLPELLSARAEAETAMAMRQSLTEVTPPPPDAEALATAIRAAGARRMGPFVRTIATDVSLDDLVASPEMRALLDDAVAWRGTDESVWNTMGVSRDSADAQGLALLFAGPPGGGKTFAARCLAHALGINLYRVDLSQVVSKYIGETEKRLAQIFDEAEAGHGVLFFDEADAVFGKRSEVKDAHDRYANIEVGFLLQRMESFGGVLVLATNLRSNLDAAFTRRMHFIVEFPMPGRAERAKLWARSLPEPAWCAPDLDLPVLAERFRLSGGNIRTCAVAAAHLAAAESAPLGMRHVARALVRELEKSGLPRGAADLGPLAAHLEGLP